MSGERRARLATAGVVLGLIAFGLGGLWLERTPQDGAIELVARQPAAGGFSRERIVAHQGERVRLRIRSEDVVHGFAIGRLGVDTGPIEPGKTVTVDFTVDRPGEYTYYCTEWCDPNHPRMRGVLEVRGRAVTETARPDPASDVRLQRLDDPRDAGTAPPARPSPERGRALYRERCATCHGAEGGALGGAEALRRQSPAAIFRELAVDARAGSLSAAVGGGAAPPHGPMTRGWSAAERWDAVAYLWSLGTTPERLALGRRLYDRNCAACHGTGGAGDGPGGRSQPKTPANFTDARRMLAGTTELYTAKIRRGGMGTGMPYWGSILAEEELGALVEFLWTFSLGHPQESIRAARDR